ncbi:MAG TPA: hypothetical protein PKL31_13220 [Fulvivirga sp.]|nr:hypothetical protein [Fulvivirga sp.]
MSRKIIVILILISFTSQYGKAQEVGLSFSYFIPKNGEFSTPISPFSLRGIGFNIGNYMALQTGFSLYRMAGMNVKNIGEIETKKAVMGPNFTLMVPVEYVFQFVGKRQEFRIKGGGFAFQTFDNKLNYGNIDRAIRSNTNWSVVNADLNFDNSLGLGYFFGAEYVVKVTRQWGLSLEANYFIGDADFPLKGSYTGVNTVGDIETKDVDYKDAKLDFTGLEISIGIIIYQ